MKQFFLIVFCTFILLGNRAVAADRPVILHSISDAEWYPIYSFSDHGQKLEGLLADLVHALFAGELQWQSLPRPRPWARAQREVADGQTDFFVTVPTESRKQYAQVTSIPLFRLYLNLYTYAGHPRLEAIQKIISVEDIKALDLVLVSNNGNGWHKSNMEDKGVKTQWVGGDNEIIRFLSMKRADAMIDVALPMNYRIEKMGLGDRLVRTDVAFGPIEFYVMVGKKSLYASRMNEINDALKRMQDKGILQQIWSKYD